MHETVIPMPGGFINGRENEIYFSNDPEDRILWIYVPAIMNAMSNFYRMMKSHRRGFDETFEDEHEMSRDARLDPIGGGHLLKRAPALDSIGGGHLLKRAPILDQIGGGHLLKRESRFKQFLTSGNAAKRRPVLDSIGGGHLLKRVVELKQFYPTESGDDYEKKLEDTLTEENIDPRRNQ